MIKKLFAPGNDSTLTGFGLLMLRLSLGLGMLFNHGLDKLNNFSAHSDKFPDPLGIGSVPSFALVTFADRSPCNRASARRIASNSPLPASVGGIEPV